MPENKDNDQNTNVVINFKSFSKNAEIPKKATPSSAGYDVCLFEDLTLKPLEINKKVWLGFSLMFPAGYHAEIKPRSSSALTYKVSIFPGLIDADFTGSLCLIISNLENIEKHFSKGFRLAQIVFYKTVEQKYYDISKDQNGLRGMWERDIGKKGAVDTHTGASPCVTTTACGGRSVFNGCSIPAGQLFHSGFGSTGH